GARGGAGGVSFAADGEGSVAPARGWATEREAVELDPAWFRADVLHLSGYALLREPAASAAERAAEHAREAGARISLDLSAWTLVDEPFRDRARRVAPDIVFATEREQEVFGPLDAAWVVKSGPRGISVGGVRHPALPAEIVDP